MEAVRRGLRRWLSPRLALQEVKANRIRRALWSHESPLAVITTENIQCHQVRVHHFRNLYNSSNTQNTAVHHRFQTQIPPLNQQLNQMQMLPAHPYHQTLQTHRRHQPWILNQKRHRLPPHQLPQQPRRGQYHGPCPFNGHRKGARCLQLALCIQCPCFSLPRITAFQAHT